MRGGVITRYVAAALIWLQLSDVAAVVAQASRSPERHESGVFTPSTNPLEKHIAVPIRRQDASVPISISMKRPTPLPRAFRAAAVLENALGDLDQNGSVNLLDLLRLRDISIGNGPPPTAYETTEGDLNGSSSIDHVDVESLRDALLGISGLPHLVGPDGGTVEGNNGRTRFLIPPGTFSAARHLRVEDYRSDAFEDDMKSSVASWGNGAIFMAGAKLIIQDPGPEDAVLPADVVLMEALPPGGSLDTTGVNAAFNIGDAALGDGIPILRPVGGLRETTIVDTLGVTRTWATSAGSVSGISVVDPLPQFQIPRLDAIDVNMNTLTVDRLSRTNGEPGTYVGIFGKDWKTTACTDYEMLWLVNGDTLVVRPAFAFGDGQHVSAAKDVRGLAVPVPALIPGTYSVRLRRRGYVRIGFRSMSPEAGLGSFTIDPLPVVIQPSMKDSILVYMAAADSAFTHVVNDSDIVDQMPETVSALAQSLQAWRAAQDSVRATPETNFDPVELAKTLRWLQNMKVHEAVAAGGDGALAQANEDPVCIDACENKLTERAILTTLFGITCGAVVVSLGLAAPWGVFWAAQVCVAGVAAMAHITGQEFRRCARRCGRCEKEPASAANAQGTGTGPFETKFGCLHFDCHRVTGTGDPPISDTAGPLEATSFEGLLMQGTSAKELIVGVNNSPIPGASVGVMQWPDGVLQIPFNLLAGDVTLFAYEPATGLFDALVAKATFGSPNDRHVVAVRFDPDTSRRRETLSLRQYVTGTVGQGVAQYEYRIYIAPELIGQSLEFGFRSAELLTCWLEGPNEFIVRDSSTSCVNKRAYEIVDAGTYKITVGFGWEGGDGEFALGMSIAPQPPTPYVCGEMADTLYAQYSPYRCENPAMVAAGRRTVMESDVEIGFRSGGSITVTGDLVGIGSMSAPIRLRRNDSALMSDASRAVPPRQLSARRPAATATAR